jgi:minor extracellular serine protease Vpr
VIAVGGIQNEVTYVQQVEVTGSGVPSDLQAIAAEESYDGPPPQTPLTAPLLDATQAGDSDGLLCNPVGVSALSGNIVLVLQGTCGDATKVTNAQSAGAVGVIEIADAASYYLPYGLSGTTIPTFIIGQSDGANLKAYVDAHPGASGTMDPRPYQVSAESQGYAPYSVAYFSSRGPVNETGALKPDLVAVATDFLMPTENYDPYGELFNFSRYGTADGTSFATPMVSGAAALVLQANPKLTPLQIKSALVNSASLSNLTTSDTSGPASITEVGSGLLQAQNAVQSSVQISPSAVSFGIQGVSLITSQPLTVTNTGNSQVTLTTSVQQSVGYSSSVTTITVTPATVTVPPNGTVTLTVGLAGGQPAAGRYEGVVAVSGGPVPLNIPYMFIVPSGIPYDVIPLNGTQPGQGYSAFDGAVGATIPWSGSCTNTDNSCVYDYGPLAVQVIDQYGAPVPDVPVAWAVTGGNGSINLDYTDPYTDSNGIAGATAILGTTPGAQEFSVSVEGIPSALPFDGYARVAPAINSSPFVVDAASYVKGRAVAPGSLIAVFGTNLSDTTQGNNGTDAAFANCSLCNVATQALPMGIDGAAFSFDTSSASLPGRMLYVSPVQLNVQVPWELAGQTSATVKVIVNYTYSAEYTLPLAQYSPGFFVYDAADDVAALDQNYKLIGSSNPVARGDYVQLFMNGLGPVTHQPGDGLAASGAPNLSMTTATPTITIGGQAAGNIPFSGLAPGYVGLYQVNVQVPTGISAGAQAITCTIGGVTATAAQLYVK